MANRWKKVLMVVNVILHYETDSTVNFRITGTHLKNEQKIYIGQTGITHTDLNLPVIWKNEKDKNYTY